MRLCILLLAVCVVCGGVAFAADKKGTSTLRDLEL